MTDITRQDYFIIGCKLLGVYCFVDAIPAIFNIVPMFIAFGNYPPDMSRPTMIVKILAIVSPVAYCLAGYFLLTSGRKLYEKIYSKDKFEKSVIEKFKLFMKMLGLFFLITYTTRFLGVLSDFLFQLFSPAYMDMFTQTQNVYTNLLPSSFGMLIGAYLLVSGKLFITIGFKNRINT